VLHLNDRPPTPQDSGFHTTRWSLLAAGSGSPSSQREAVEWLCRDYWMPLFRHVRRQGYNHEESLDLTQGFFAALLDHESPLATADRERGRFRSWLLAALNHYLSDARDRSRALKRGGGVTLFSLDDPNMFWEPPDHAPPPDVEFDRHWALTVMERGMTALADEYAKRGASEQWLLLSPFLTSRSDAGSYQPLADKLGTTPQNVAVAVKRMRDRFRERIRALVRETVGSGDVLDEEMAHLLAALRPT
jgi:DNA-directed RNA polymerase specialized sigma24 family protein